MLRSFFLFDRFSWSRCPSPESPLDNVLGYNLKRAIALMGKNLKLPEVF